MVCVREEEVQVKVSVAVVVDVDVFVKKVTLLGAPGGKVKV